MTGPILLDVLNLAHDLMPVREAIRNTLSEEQYADNSERVAKLMDVAWEKREDGDSRLDTIRRVAPVVANRLKAKANAGEFDHGEGQLRYHLFLAGALEWMESRQKEVR